MSSSYLKGDADQNKLLKKAAGAELHVGYQLNNQSSEFKILSYTANVLFLKARKLEA